MLPSSGTYPSRLDPQRPSEQQWSWEDAGWKFCFRWGRGGKALDRRVAFLPDGVNKHFPT